MYHIVLVKRHGKWSIDFGSYSKRECVLEQQEIKRHEQITSKQCKVISSSSDLQKDLDIIVQYHNMIGM